MTTPYLEPLDPADANRPLLRRSWLTLIERVQIAAAVPWVLFCLFTPPNLMSFVFLLLLGAIGAVAGLVALWHLVKAPFVRTQALRTLFTVPIAVALVVGINAVGALPLIEGGAAEAAFFLTLSAYPAYRLMRWLWWLSAAETAQPDTTPDTTTILDAPDHAGLEPLDASIGKNFGLVTVLPRSQRFTQILFVATLLLAVCSLFSVWVLIGDADAQWPRSAFGPDGFETFLLTTSALTVAASLVIVPYSFMRMFRGGSKRQMFKLLLLLALCWLCHGALFVYLAAHSVG